MFANTITPDIISLKRNNINPMNIYFGLLTLKLLLTGSRWLIILLCNTVQIFFCLRFLQKHKNLTLQYYIFSRLKGG